jgi:hypothetical protein
MEEALAVSLIHDTATRGQPAAVDLAGAEYEDSQTRFIPYWERSELYRIHPDRVLGSLYLKPDRALLVLGSQTEQAVTCRLDLSPLLARLPATAEARDPIRQERLSLAEGRLSLALPGRGWRMIELK